MVPKHFSTFLKNYVSKYFSESWLDISKKLKEDMIRVWFYISYASYFLWLQKWHFTQYTILVLLQIVFWLKSYMLEQTAYPDCNVLWISMYMHSEMIDFEKPMCSSSERYLQLFWYSKLLIDSYFAFKLLQMKRKMMDNTQPNKTIPLAVYINDMKTFKKSVIRIKDEDSSEFHTIIFTFSC